MRFTPPLFLTPNLAVKEIGRALREQGNVVEPKLWQGVEAPRPMLELLEPSFRTPMTGDIDELRRNISPNLPWADDHFEERVSGVPHNPPPSSAWWPFNPSSFEFREEDEYTHTYPERMWPKTAGRFVAMDAMGIRYKYGDLLDVVKLLQNDPGTRQAFLPIWFPEDTGSVHGGRVPCTLGYLFMAREGHLHLTYYIRSCDYFRHLRDDIYLAIRLALWMIERTRLRIQPGFFNMHIGSLHCWAPERSTLPK